MSKSTRSEALRAESAQTNPDVSVIVPTYERSYELERTLSALSEQRTDLSFEVVVADDGSAGGLVGVIQKYESRLNIVYARQRDKGFRLSAARNLGARLARGEVLVFLDCGTLAGPTLIEAHAACVRSGRRASTGPTLGWNFSGSEAVQFRELVAGEDWRHRCSDMRDRPGYADYRSEKWTDIFVRRVPMALAWRYFWGRNVAVSRTDFEFVGGFDEGFRSYGVEDVEFGYRLERCGVELSWVESAWAVELPSITEDATSQAIQNRNNLAEWADRCVDMEVEFFICNRPLAQLEQPEWERICHWAESSVNTRDDLEVLGSVAAAERRGTMLFVGLMVDVAHGSGVFALGPGFRVQDGGWYGPGDQVSGRSGNFNAIGIRTGFGHRVFDVVYVSDAMAPLARVWGRRIVEEATRCGRSVELGRLFAKALDDLDARTEVR